MMCARANVSHLTCNKAEQISCSLPLNVRLPPQGVRISFKTLSSPRPPRSQQFFPPDPREGDTSTVRRLIAGASFFTRGC